MKGASYVLVGQLKTSSMEKIFPIMSLSPVINDHFRTMMYQIKLGFARAGLDYGDFSCLGCVKVNLFWVVK